MTSQRIRSLYLHAPFCARRCFYCDFAVKVRRTGDLDAWIRGLTAELSLRERQCATAEFPLDDRLETLYIGGGTPSLLGPGAMMAVREMIGSERLGEGGGVPGSPVDTSTRGAPGAPTDRTDAPTTAQPLEWTAEANPESLTPEVAAAWWEAGTNRLSLGVQSFQPEVLRWMGRLHGARGAERAVEVARDAGFREISIDLIFGLPESVGGSGGRDWTADLDRTLSLEIPHVSLYGLTAEPGTGLGRGVAAGRVRMTDDERYRDEYLEAHRRLTEAGYRHYEVSNFALPGSESRHNQRYWDGSPWLGLGNGAHSYLPPRRFWNLHDWDDYLQRAEAGDDPTESEEEVGPDAMRLEQIWTALRTDRGLDPSHVQGGLGAPARARMDGWVESGKAREVEGRVALTAEGWLLLDSLAVELDS